MKHRIFSALLAMMLIMTTVDITAFAQPAEEVIVETIAEEGTEEGTEEATEEMMEESIFVDIETVEEELAVESTTDSADETDEELDTTLLEEVMTVLEEVQEADAVLSTNSVTRIEWLRTLVETFDMVVESDNYPDNYFTDIDSTYEYYHEVMVATEFGLVDVEAGDPLNPDEPANREFAAHSLNVCLGYVADDENYTFEEAQTVTHPADIQVAINRGWFALSDGSFLPEQAITAEEMNIMVADAEKAIAATTLDPNHVNTYDLKDNVIVLPEGTDAHLTNENEITIYNCTQELEAGDIFALISDGFPAVKRVKSITTEENAIIIQTESVATEDAFNSLDIQGTMDVELTEVQASDANTTLKYIVGGTQEQEWEDGIKYDSVEALGNREVSAIEVIKSYEIPESVQKEYDIEDGVKATISCKVSNPKATYDSTHSSAFFQVGMTTTFSCNVSMDVLEAIGQAPTITLVKMPIAYVAYMNVTLEMVLEGELNIQFVEYISAGVYYDSVDGFRITTHFYKEAFTIQAQAKASLGVKAAIGIDWCVLTGSIYARVGMTAHIKSELYTDGESPLNCTHLNAYLYASVGCNVSVNLLLYKDSWSKSKDIYTLYNSPIKVSHHYEDGQPVDRCTRDAKLESGSRKWKYYTPADSKYSYSGVSSGTGSSGEAFTIFDYTLDSNNLATITGYYGNVSGLSIPKTLDGYTVVAIAKNTFKDNTALRMVAIPDTVTFIGNHAFDGCVNLSEIILSDSLEEIQYAAFHNCISLTSIEIPKSLDKTSKWNDDSGVFSGCVNLKKVTFEEGITQIPEALFALCPGLTQIEIPDTVTTIEKWAFYKCTNLKEVEMPDSVTTVGAYAFEDCTSIENIELSDKTEILKAGAFKDCSALTEIIIPNSVTTIEEFAFANCINLSKAILSKALKEIQYAAFHNCDSLTAIEIPKNLDKADKWNDEYGVFSECDNLKTFIFEVGTTQIPETLFALCSSLEEITLPNTVTNIEKYAFYKCTNLKVINVPDSVTTIGTSAFEGCTNMKSATLSIRTTAIGQSAFHKCSSLEEIVIPDRVTTIGAHAFKDCIKLSKVTLSKALKEIQYAAFHNCDALTTIEIPKSLDKATKWNDEYGVFSECANLQNVTFEEGTTQIPEALFALCPGIGELVIPDTVTTIEKWAFYESDGLTQITIPGGVKEIGRNAFEGAGSLHTVALSEGLTTIKNTAFKDCSALKEILLPNSVMTMGTDLFNGCTNLERAVLPNTCTSVTDDMFRNCSSLKEIVLPETVTTISEYAFYGNKALEKVDGGENVTSIEKYAFYDCDALTEITIADTCTSLATYAFAECENLSEVKLGSGITTIPTYAFYRCSSIVKMELPYAVTTVQGYAFAECTTLAEVTIPRATTNIADTVFSYPSLMTIYGVAGTYAETFANDKMITFVNQEVNATDVQLLHSEVTVNKGSSTRLVLSVAPSNFTDAVKWKSSDTDIVTVDNTGVIKAVGLGSAKVVVSVGGITKNCMVTVVQPVTSISISKSSLSMEGGSTYQLSATVYPSSANNKSFVWSSSDETIAMVSETGLVTALKKGSAVITATALDGSGKTDTCNVTVTSTVYHALTVEEMQSNHPYEDNCSDSWVYTVADAESLEVFFSEDTEVEEDFDYIYIYTKAGKQVGKYTGTALAGKKIEIKGDTVRIQLVSDDATGVYGFCVTEIREKLPVIALKSITLDKPGMELSIGDTQQLTINYNPINATLDTSAVWSSNNKAVATVENGLVTAVGKGSATITASVKGKTAKCTVMVKPSIEDIFITTEELELHEGECSYIQVSTLPLGVWSSGSIEWLDYDEDIISVKALPSESRAEIKGLQAGTTEIKVCVDGVEKTCSVTILPNEVILDYQNEEGEGKINAIIGEPIAALPSQPERDGYIFAGWYTEADGKGELVTESTILTNQWKLYAYWEPVKDGMWVRPVGDRVYTGKEIRPSVEVYDGMTKLVLGQDYKVSYKYNKNVASVTDDNAPMITVKGIGQYKDSAKVYFNIVPKSIEDMDIIVEPVYKAISNKVQKLVPVIKWGKITLKKNKDFIISHPETEEGAYKTAGQYEIRITGNGNYTGTRSVYQVLSEKGKVLMSKVSVKKLTSEDYFGSPIYPEPEVSYKKTPLIKGVDYELEYENNTEIGTATIKIVGKGIYSGVKKVTFKINGLNLSKAEMSKISPYEYSGNAKEPHPTLNIGTEELIEGTDYLVSYKKNIDAGKAQIIFKGIGRCKGTLTKNFTIQKYNISSHTLEETDIVCEYTKGGSKPEVTLIIDGKELVLGKDYKVTYSRNKAVNAGTIPNKAPMLTVIGKGNYDGEIKQSFKIEPKSLQDVTITAQDVITPSKKNKWKSTPVLIDVNGKKLSVRTDYASTFKYTYVEDALMQDGTTREKDSEVDKNDIPVVGTQIKITVNGLENYEKSTEVIYSIVPASIAKAKVTITPQTYTGEKIFLDKNDISVKVGGKDIDKGYFEIVDDSYVNNLNKGTASVTIKGTNNYGGTKTATFKINPKSIIWRVLESIME